MDKKAYKKLEKLKLERSRIKERKAYVLSKIRKYPVDIQRAVVSPLWRAIMDIERQIDILVISNSNTSLVHDAEDIKVRTLPLGCIENIENYKKADEFGFYRAEPDSLFVAFGASKQDLTEYIDDMILPDLFLGPFEYKSDNIDNTDNKTMQYFVLLNEAVYYLYNQDNIKIIPDIIVSADKLSVTKDQNPDICKLADAFTNKKTEIENFLNVKIKMSMNAKISEILPDVIIAYHNQRKLHNEYIAEKTLEKFTEKDLKKIKKIKKYYGIIDQ